DAAGFVGRAALLAGAVAGAAVVIGALVRPAWRLDAYPVAELTWMQRAGLLSKRVATQDFVGNLRTLREGPHGEVFIDDRYDMYPTRVTADYVTLLRGRPAWGRVLQRWHVDAVLWERDTALAALITASRDWQVVHRTKGWVVAVRVR
ncbi:MAG: hypothetical protein C4344_06690, partial [Acidimicrobiia bacterium]